MIEHCDWFFSFTTFRFAIQPLDKIPTVHINYPAAECKLKLYMYEKSEFKLQFVNIKCMIPKGQ